MTTAEKKGPSIRFKSTDGWTILQVTTRNVKPDGSCPIVGVAICCIVGDVEEPTSIRTQVSFEVGIKQADQLAVMLLDGCQAAVAEAQRIQAKK